MIRDSSPSGLLGVLALVLACTAIVPAAWAQEGGVAFLRIRADAAGFAIGDGGLAVSAGALAAERNPAGLAVPGGPEAALAHVRWISDQQSYAAAGRFQLSRNVGASLFVRATSSGELQARTRPGEPEGTFDAQFVTAGGGLARGFGPFRLGATARYVSERIFDVSSDGYAFDLGAQADLLGGGLQLGAVWQYLGKMERLGTQRSTLPRTVGVGAAIHPFRILAWVDGSVILDAFVTADWTRNTVDGVERLHLGLSAEVLETFLARVGYVTNDDLRSFSAGAGITVDRLILDYALLPFDSGFGGPGHVFTVRYQL